MFQEIPKKIKQIYKKLGFKCDGEGGEWSAEKIFDENNSISVDFCGTVYVNRGFNKYGSEYYPICVKSFQADTPAKIEVLVEPLIEPNFKSATL